MATVSSVLDDAGYYLNDRDHNEWGATELLKYLNQGLRVLDSTLFSLDSDWVRHVTTAYLATGYNQIAAPTRFVSMIDMFYSTTVVNLSDLTFAAVGDTITSAAQDFDDAGFSAGDEIYVGQSTSNDGLYRISSISGAGNNIITVYGDLTNEGTADASAVIVKKDQNRVYEDSLISLDRRRINNTATGTPGYFAERRDYILLDCAASTNYGLIMHFEQKSADLTSGGNMPYNDEFNDQLRQVMIEIAKARNSENKPTDAYLQAIFKNAAMQKAITRKFVPRRYVKDF